MNYTKIIMYGADWCGSCIRPKMFFEDNNMKYEYINIDSDKKHGEYVISVNPNGYRSIPVIEIYNNEELIARFIEPAYIELKKFFKV